MEKGEKTLVKRAMRGNPKAFGTLVEREQEYLYRMAFLYVRQEQDALDVVQESILKAYKSLKTLREPEYFRTWLTKILINTAQDLLRKRKPEASLAEGPDLPAPEGMSPEERMDLHWAVAQLPGNIRPNSNRPARFRPSRVKSPASRATTMGDCNWNPQPSCWPAARSASSRPPRARKDSSTPPA